jgi:thymidine kinase
MIKFYYGTMGAGKTTELLKTYDIYKRKSKKPLIIKPNIDNREGDFNGWGFTSSRITKDKAPAYYYSDINDIKDFDFGVLLIDEAQFCDKKDIDFICKYADEHKIDVLSYGLKTDVNGNLFFGAEKWLALADEIKELENLCQIDGCMCKAVAHKRFIDGKPDNSGKSVVIDKGNVTYLSVCRKHWREL